MIGSQYRGNMGGEGKEEFGGSDVNDVLNLVPALSHVEKADTTRMGMYGWSRGGMMTYLALTKTNRMRAAIITAAAATMEAAITPAGSTRAAVTITADAFGRAPTTASA